MLFLGIAYYKCIKIQMVLSNMMNSVKSQFDYLKDIAP